MPSRRTRLLKLFHGLASGKLARESLCADLPVFRFYLFSNLPGYIENEWHIPITPKEFRNYARYWPGPGLQYILKETPVETLLKSVNKRLETNDPEFSFLWDVVPDDTAEQWRTEKVKRGKQKAKEEEKTRLEKELMAELWATLHPLNQEWNIPPPPTDLESDTDRRLNDWVHQYQPYMYLRNGRLMRKMSANRHEMLYEESYEDLTFPSDTGGSAAIYTPGGEREGERERVEAGRGVLLYARNDAESTGRDRSRPVPNTGRDRSRPVPNTPDSDAETNAPVPPPEPPPPRKYRVSDFDQNDYYDDKIKKLAAAMRTLWTHPKDKESNDANLRAAQEAMKKAGIQR